MIVSGLCVGFRLGALQGLHQASHEYRLALYGSEADLGLFTESYTPEGEVSGQGYTPGGLPLTGYQLTVDGTTVRLQWDQPVWPTATIRAAGFLIFNNSLPDLSAVATHDFGRIYASTNGPFRLLEPPRLEWATR